MTLVVEGAEADRGASSAVGADRDAAARTRHCRDDERRGRGGRRTAAGTRTRASNVRSTFAIPRPAS